MHDIDDMQNVVAQNLEGRQKEAVKARRIVDEELENYLAVEDEATLNAVFAIFKEKFQDVFTFED